MLWDTHMHTRFSDIDVKTVKDRKVFQNRFKIFAVYFQFHPGFRYYTVFKERKPVFYPL